MASLFDQQYKMKSTLHRKLVLIYYKLLPQKLVFLKNILWNGCVIYIIPFFYIQQTVLFVYQYCSSNCFLHSRYACKKYLSFLCLYFLIFFRVNVSQIPTSLSLSLSLSLSRYVTLRYVGR